MKHTVDNNNDNNLRSILIHEQTGACHKDFLELFLAWNLADLPRSRETFSVIRIAVRENQEQPSAYHDVFSRLGLFLSGQLRKTDLLFETENNQQFILVLMHTGETEAAYFMKRIQMALLREEEPLSRVQCIGGMVAVRNPNTTYKDIMDSINRALELAMEKEAFHLEQGVIEAAPDTRQIRVTIIDDDVITQNIVTNLIEGLQLDNTTFDIQTFNDGSSFISSNRYYSSHTQIIFLSDILPQRDGMEVLKDLRQMPNSDKYLIFMLGSRNTENETIYTLENGADDYIAKPFNIKLLQAKVKRMIKRLASW
ncbi:response regulator transcription factor [Paenibacillus marinisediminis]